MRWREYGTYRARYCSVGNDCSLAGYLCCSMRPHSRPKLLQRTSGPIATKARPQGGGGGCAN